jgi:hypothetical protein
MFVLVAAAALAAAPLSAEARPLHPYAERTGSGVEVDGDLLVRNSGNETWELIELSLDVRDSRGVLLQRKELNGNGTSPSIKLVTERKVEAGKQLLIFNPLARFAADVQPAQLDFSLTFEGPNKKRLVVPVTVLPRSEPPERFAFPLKGRVLVWDGHDFASHHRRWNYVHPVIAAAGFHSNAERYSFDLILIDPKGKRSTGDEAVNANWASFGAPVRAVAAGKVVALREDQKDDRTFDVATVNVPNTIFGNYIIIAHEDGSYSLYGHLQQGSVVPAIGEGVVSGQRIAKIGASGSALFPHLHFQRMNGPNDRSEGVPTHFKRLTRPNGQPVANGFVDSGDVVIAP